MDPTPLMDLLDQLKTEAIIRRLVNMNTGELIHNPWFLGGTAALSILALFMRWRVLLCAILSLAGFSALVSYTLRQGADAEVLSTQTLLVFTGGGVAIITLVIYLLFIKID